MIKPVLYVTSGVGIFTLIIVLYLFFRTLYRLVFDIHLPTRIIIHPWPAKPPTKSE